MEALGVQAVNLIAAALSACGVMVLWFETSFVLDYLKLLRLEKEFIEEYEKELFENPDIKLLEFSYFKNPTLPLYPESMTPARTSIPFFTASPDLGATLP